MAKGKLPMKQILSIGLLAWSTAHAVELGSIALTSVSGEPLRAQIPILLAQGESLEQLAASIIETKPSEFSVDLVLAEGPSPHINLSSKKPITVEKLGLTLQVIGPEEDTEYHYDLTLAPSAPKANAAAGKPYVYGPVKSGETLWQVATVFAKQYNLTPDQAMVALHEHNKKAFGKGNQNQLMAGSYLSLPAKIGKVLTPPKHPTVRFKPTEVVTQTHTIEEPAPPLAEVTVIPEFPEMEQGTQVAMNVTPSLPGVPSLKLLNPLSDASTALFSNTLTSVLGAEDTAFVKLLDTMQQDLKIAHEAIELERQAKKALQAQVNDMQIQLRALTELISLQQSVSGDVSRNAATAWSVPALFHGVGNNPLALLMAAIAMATLIMYAWEHFMAPKAVSAAVTPSTPAPAVVRQAPTKPHVIKTRTMPSLSDVDQYIQQGRYYQAQEMLGTLLAKQPNDFDALYKLCQVYTKSDNRTGYEAKMGQISTRWRMMYPERFDRLQDLYEQTWSSAMSAHDRDIPVYEGDPPSDPVQTKLDLARAYIDIGDQSSAYEILGEVLKEGTASQVSSAQVLMSQIKL